MSTEENKALVRRFVEEALNQGDLAALEEFFSEDYVDHSAAPGQAPGIPGVIQSLAMLRIAFPDFEASYEEMVAEGDLVASRYTLRGTHRGELLGVPPTGNPVAWTGMNMFRFSEGLIVESWDSEDTLGLMQQLGIVPLSPSTSG